MEYQELVISLRKEAEAVKAAGDDWRAERVAERLEQIAELLAKIRRQHESGINASMGKRSGSIIDI